MHECVTIGNATLYHGDCLEILPTLPKVDAVITDPPYGVMLGLVDNGQARAKQQTAYTAFVDSPEYLKETVVRAIEECRARYGRVIATVGSRNAFEYPAPDDIGVWFNPAGTGVGKWGFCCAHVILYYGRDPRAGIGATPSSITGHHGGRDEQVNHPCPKPSGFMRWMVNKGSVGGESVLDPFMGSGTTGVACMQLGRKFTGIEIERRYFDIACERIENAQRQERMFAE